MPSSPNSILKAIRQLINKNTLENANQLASLAGLTLEDPNKKIEVIEHTTKNGKVIRGVVRTDLSYAEAKAIDEYTFKKDGGWFIRDKYLGLESQPVASQQTPTETAQNEPVASFNQDTVVSDDDNNIEALKRKFKQASKKYKQPEIKLDTKEGVKLLKKTLTKLFPDTKFSVTMARGTAYGSAYVSWVDGASYNLVGTIAQHFRGSGFDGMTDSSHSLYALNEDGKVVDYGLGFISFSRSYSREFLEKLQSSFPDMLQNMIKQEGVTIKGDGFNAYFDAKERWTQDKINEAKISHSTGKYNFGNVPQAANDEPVGKDEKREFLQGLLKYANEKVSTFVDDSGNNIKKVQKTVNGQFAAWQYNKFRELFGLARTVSITNTETISEGINLTGKYASESNNYHAYSISYEPIANDDNFSLQSLTEAERLANELRIKAAEQAKQQVEEQARLKAQADKELNDFRLSGSSAPSDIAASYGQGDMFVQTRGQQKKGEPNVPSTSNALESDIKPTSTPDSQQGIKNSNDDESGQPGRMARPSINRPNEGGGSQRDRSIGLSENDGISLGIGSDTSVFGVSGQRGTGAGDTTTESGGSNSTNGKRPPNERVRDRTIVRTAIRNTTSIADAKEAEQLKAEGTPTQWGDAANIDKALPYLLPEQRDDVAKLEKRLIEENKNGMLFTNGTGTGKTFTGLGAVKRFANAGKKNILIVSMNDKIIRDFIKSAKSLNLDVHQLDGITDNGKDKIVATTYANMAQNNTLGMRDWDLIIVDEAHNLMQGEKGENTNALDKLRALSGHYAGFNEWVKMRHADKDPKPVGESPETGLPIYNQDEVAAWEEFKKPLREQWKKTWSEQPKGRTKVIFLTATPFSYVKTLDWAEGYLFDFVPPADKFSNKTDAMGSAYNSGGAQERFYMNNFGYKMRTNRLTRPDSKVDVGILERKFAEKLKTEGAMSGRELSVPFDYDRKFVLVNSKIGEKIDEGFRYLWDTKDKNDKRKFGDLLRVINKRFDYLARLQLLEAIKAEEAIGQIKKHLALGRKVIVFHDYNVGGSTNPFILKGSLDASDAEALETQYSDFKKERPDLINLKLDIPAPLVTLKKAFPNALMFNGTVSKGQRVKNADLFNADGSGFDLMIAQSDAAATGISFHDTTGKHQRVIINIGMPTKPAKLRQTEGRIYRVGQASNAIQRYLTTGTGWERSAFAQKIAERAETVDNLAQGESAVVSIKDALVQAYEEAEYFEPSENDGIGGKAYDEENARINKLTPFERAKSDYWVKQKVTAKRGEREGKEWYATPEPVGLFMVNLAGAHSGDDILEPSAGDGAIGRYMPSDASVTFIEPSESLASRARMNNTNANVIIDDFENHNSSNKYDAIVMNPPFGQGGSIAIKHLVKAFEHLREGGRVVALLPVGKMDELIAKYQVNGYFKDIYTVAEFTLPSSTFENAGTRVNTKIHVFEKHENKADAPQGIIRKDLSHYDDISRLFDAIENISIKPRKPRVDEALAEYGIEIYPNNSKYVVSGEGLKRIDITATLFTSYDKKNSDGDYVEKYNRSSAFLRWLKEAKIPTMAQFNQGLSANNLPIKYQDVRGRRHNTWDGVGDKPYWLEQSMRYGAKLEDFAVEKPVYDSVTNNDHKVIIAAIRKLMANNTPENARALAEAAGLRIRPAMDLKTFSIESFIENKHAAKESTFSTDKEVKALAVNVPPIKKYKSGSREWQKFCRDASVEYARLYQSYMNDKTDYDSFIKKKELSPLGKISIKNIERVVSRNFYKWREIDIVQFDLKPEYLENNRFDDIGGFNFEPMVSVDATMQAIKKLIAENTLDNARYLAMIAGLKLKEDEPSQDLDMFGEPINQDFDLFGDPIQDGEESPVEELPRLAVVELPLSKLTLSEDVPQFKSGADGESGVVEALGGKFDRTGVAPIQVWERTDGRLEIISGRHRTDLARRSGEKTIPAQVHKESEGFTAKQAMMLDAELNIRDGQGKVKDYVDYFTHSEISEDEADKRGLLARSIGQRAFTIASKGSDELKTLHRNEIISDQAAAEIASIVPKNSGMQAVGLRVLQEHKPLNNALNTIRAVQALTREKGQETDTFDLFGFDDSALKEAEAMARIASRKQRQIAEQLNAIKGAVKNPKLAAKQGVVVENEADALAKVQAMTTQKARWDNWSSHADLLAEVRAELNAKFDSLLDDEDDYYWLCQEELAL